MDHKKRRNAITGAVVSASVVVSLICIFIISGSQNPPRNLGNTQPPKIGASSSISNNVTANPNTKTGQRTPPVIYTNSTYDGDVYNPTDVNNTISKTPSPTPVPTFVDTKLNSSPRIELVSFNTKASENTSKYNITLNFNKNGQVKLIAIDSVKGLSGDITADYIRGIFNGSIDKNQLSAANAMDSGYVTANTDHTFQITVDLDKFDLFVILDGDNNDIYISKPICLSSLGGVPKWNGIPTVSLNTDTNQLEFNLVTTINTNIVVKMVKSDQILPLYINSAPNDKTTDLSLKYSIPVKASYDGCSVQATIRYTVNGVTVTDEYTYILNPSLSLSGP